MIKKVSSYFFQALAFILLSLQALGQQKIPAIENWRVHLPFSNNNTLCENGNKIFVGSASGIFTFDESDKSLEILSKINGLSDVDIKILSNNPTTNSIIVIYNNSNIDIIEGSNIYNINDILTQITIGEKRINNVSFYNEFAYLSSSIGIIVVDMNKKRIVDSYSNLGTNGSNVEFLDVEVFQGNIYASSPIGMYRAPLNSFNLSDYHSWQKLSFSYSTYSLLATYNNKLYAILDSTLYTTTDVINWIPYSVAVKNPITVQINNGKLVSTTAKDVFIEDQTGTVQTKNFNGLYGSYLGNENTIYLIAYNAGLIMVHPDGALDFYSPSGPIAKSATRMIYNHNDNSLIVASGSIIGFGLNTGWGPKYNGNKFYRFTDNTWHNYTQTGNAVFEKGRDFVDVAIDPKNNHAFFASLAYGLYEIDYSSPTLGVTLYDSSNSTLGSFVTNGIWVSGICFDKNGNLWMSNLGAVKQLSIKTKNNQWFSYKTGIDKTAFITCDDNNYKWILNSSNQGILIYDDRNDPSNPNIHQTKILTKDKLNGFLPSNTVFCATKDMKGEMWVGTDQGLCIFSNTQNIFTTGNFDAHQLVIKTGLVYSNFLGTEAIYCIKVDAANRKWIGTKNGVWLVSEDGYTVLKNFTTNNSPLLANAVYEIGINDKTGEVFFATENGIISYLGTATIGTDEQGEALIYPNPVRPDYHGLIAIRGLVNDANVKVTDIAGNLVYETKSNGGMATWNGLNLTGKRAASGVYIIYSSNSDATQQWVGKILFIN